MQTVGDTHEAACVAIRKFVNGLDLDGCKQRFRDLADALSGAIRSNPDGHELSGQWPAIFELLYLAFRLGHETGPMLIDEVQGEAHWQGELVRCQTVTFVPPIAGPCVTKVVLAHTHSLGEGNNLHLTHPLAPDNRNAAISILHSWKLWADTVKCKPRTIPKSDGLPLLYAYYAISETIATLEGVEVRSPVPKQKMNDCQENCMTAIKAAGHRMQTEGLLDKLQEIFKGSQQGERLVKGALAELVDRGLLSNTTRTRGAQQPKGYGLPDWP